MNRNFINVLLVILMGTLSSCGVTDYLFEEEDREFIDELTIKAYPNMNHRAPMKVDFVVIKNPIIAEQVGKLTARQFMKQRKQLKRDHPKSIKIQSFELIPSETVIMPLRYMKNEIAAAFIFADYNNHHPNRWNVYEADCVTVHLMERTAKITSNKWGQEEKIKHRRKDDGVIILT